ncbi:MAG: Dyp-type peroxidase [Polyangiaceae bacterium]|nr:Dyp-type peroxidase [Polyangiaceae bacterium]NUQ75143.1 Dyp-type peroxidase [Polyangiaceae bacterium]
MSETSNEAISAPARSQRGIFEPVPPVGAVMVFDADPGTDVRKGLSAIRSEGVKEGGVVLGIGQPLALSLRASIKGLRGFPAMSGLGVAFPSTQGALWVLVRGSEQGEVLDRSLSIQRKLGVGFRLMEEVEGFRYRGGRDLTGYEDGTENPKGEAAVEAAVVAEGEPGVALGTFVAVQRYVHDLERFQGYDAAARDAIIGRRADTNEEIPDAVASAHVKRSAQESFDPPAFMLRRSMPWGGVREHGLYFIAYVESLDRFERVLHRMAGLDDGTVDGLMGFTRAISGGYYFCPPLADDGGLDLRAFGM